MLKAVNQWCFPEHTPLETMFRISADAGLEAVELNLYDSGGTGLTLDTTAAEAEAIGHLARGHGLRLRSLSTGLLWQSPLSSPDPSLRERGRQVIAKQLELASVLGADTVLVVPGAVTKDVPYEDCYRRSQEELRKLLPVAEEAGVRIGIENVWNKFLLSPMEAARYVDELDSSFAGIYFDVGNVLQFGYPEQWIRLLGQRIFKIHVKDFRTGIGNIQGFTGLLSGDVDWPAVHGALKEIGYDDTVAAELSAYAHSPYQLIYDTSRHFDVILQAKR